MMDIKFQKLDSDISRLYSQFWSGKPESLRQLLSDSPSQELEYLLKNFDLTKLVIRSRKRQDLIRIAILSWYFPEEIRILVQLQLQDTWKTDDSNVEKEILLSSKELCLAWIITESGWTRQSFFGNILNRNVVQRLVNSLTFFRISQKKVKRYTGYCRGYRESNRGAPRSFPPELEVWVLDEEELASKRLNRQMLLDQMLARCQNYLDNLTA
jgi:hypothetical protein